MDLPLDDPWLNGLVNLVVLGSVAAWIYLVARWRRYGELLPWQPRRPVPWGPPATIFAVVLSLLAVLSWPGGDGSEHGAHDADKTNLAANLATWIVSQLLLAGGFATVIALAYEATWDDLALPRSAKEFCQNIIIGLVAGTAAMLPTRLAQAALLWLMGRGDEVSRHPLVESLMEGGAPSTLAMILAGISAVVVAPACEEVLFRLLLQGWLEKWEDGRIARHPETASAEAIDGTDETEITPDERQPVRGVFGMPHGWLPILASSFLFGIAHFGYGPEPIPLFLFAIFLGYIFQRTHRILPCIVAHALFNLVSIIMLWRLVIHAAD